MKKYLKSLLKPFTLLLLSIILISSIPATPTFASTVNLYRFYNGIDHFYTTDYIEGIQAGYSFEGSIAKVSTSSYTNELKPIYRYYNGTDHFYTNDWNELGYGKYGYTYEKVAFYAVIPCPYQKSYPITLYRFYNGTDHFYTTNWDEGHNAGYTCEGILSRFE